MAKLTFLIVLASCLAVTAFSLEKPAAKSARFSNALRPLKKSSSFNEKPLPYSFALSSEGAASTGEVVASSSGSNTNKSFIDAIWNDNTKLVVYLAVWYLGNIYCESNYLIQLKR
jgi:hypothetical protein